MLMLWILLTEPRSTEMRGEQTDAAGQVPPVNSARLQTTTLRPGGQRAAAGPPPARPSAVRRATLSVCGSASCEVTSGPHLPTPYTPAPHGHTQPLTPTPHGRVCPHGTSQPPISVSCGLHHGEHSSGSVLNRKSQLITYRRSRASGVTSRSPAPPPGPRLSAPTVTSPSGLCRAWVPGWRRRAKLHKKNPRDTSLRKRLIGHSHLTP